eukprot:g47875.t1
MARDGTGIGDEGNGFGDGFKMALVFTIFSLRQLDAVAKILYSLLFSWLTDRINKLVSPKTESLSIAILDIYGFEEEYIREQIDWKEVTFSDNQTCLDLISQKPHGILRILDDQSTFPQVYKFIEKNHDQVRQDVMELFVNSKTKILTSLFSGQTMKVMSTRNNTINHRYQPPTVAAKFQQSLMELAEKMESCNPFFVRCIKPNNKKESELFEVDVVSLQLRYSGVLETIRIRKEGYPVRITFDNFIKSPDNGVKNCLSCSLQEADKVNQEMDVNDAVMCSIYCSPPATLRTE